jgi:hypothetical protein
MKRLVVLTAGAALLLSTGCTHDGVSSLRKSLGGDPPGRGLAPGGKEPVTIPKASVEVAQRVEFVGRKLLAQNTFSGLEADSVQFMVLGVKEIVLFHRGAELLFVSEGIVEKCQTDAELAAVLCAEMGKMVAERRAARAVRRDADPIPEVGPAGGPLFPGGTATDAGRQANAAVPGQKPGAAPDPAAAARELLQGAGYSPAELDRVEALLKPSERGEKIRTQMGGSAPPPSWEK